ncbi:myogenesis-regulating glycosidase isoform X3 [Folsomia candida]|uniref:myogenesis-regulating glycosidase isoform X3 n=1 Tax=Folsomia candida TaxID=158441 RepID=UPI001604D32A|nr:myogenesis-regulating glycosidase isoform X3 [Folsomia candida]
MSASDLTKQTKPPINSSFDDLVEAGGIRVPDACPSPLPPARRRIGQVTGPSKSGLNYEPVHSESEEISDLDMSETESPVSSHPVPSGRVRVGISLDPKGRSTKKTKKKGELDDDTEICLKPLATRRNSGIIPLKIADSNFLKSDPDGDTTDEDVDNKGDSPVQQNGGNKFTKIFKDKLNSVPIPKIFHKRKPKEYKLQVFVAILFLTIILLVGSIYVIHQEKELQKSYFDRIRFSHKDRRIRVSNEKGKDILTGILGANLAKKDKAWPCLKQDEKPGHTCLEWMNKARLYFRIKHQNLMDTGFSAAPNDSTAAPEGRASSLRCYEIYWEAINPDFKLKDCYSLGERGGGHFYGGGEIPGSDHWPLNKTSVPYSPFITGNRMTSESDTHFQWGRTLGRFFINSDGAAIQITEDTPLHVSINEDGDRKLCLGSRFEGYGNDPQENGQRNRQNGPTRPLHLNYTICTGENALETAELLADKDIWDGLKHEDLQVARLLAQSPIWRILPETINHGHFSEAALLNYTDRIASLHLSEGYILFDESWQQRIGDLAMDLTRFPTMDETLNITRRRGFKVALTIQPFFSTQSRNYEEGLYAGDNDDEIWLAEKNSDKKKVPALTQYKNWTSVAVLDCTKSSAQQWLEKKVSAVVDKYRIDALYVDLGTTYDLPKFYEFSKPLSSSDYYKDLFLKALRPIQHVRTIVVSSAVKLPKLPTFVSLSPTESSWEGLQSVIPNILTMGVAGYPFIIPGAIGGDFWPVGKSNASYRMSSEGSFRVPDRDLYIRWLELVHFLPVVQYSFLPSDYDQKVVDIATNMYFTRKNKLYPYIKKAIDQSLTTGLPVIRPLWMIDPTDATCLKISDEFSIGEDIIVAPVIRPGEVERDIYLPKGIWRNEMDGSPTKGEKWLHHYRVKENQIPFFTKMPGVGSYVLDN